MNKRIISLILALLMLSGLLLTGCSSLGGEGEGEGEEAPEKTYVTKYETWFDFAFQEKIVDPYYTMFGDPDKVAA